MANVPDKTELGADAYHSLVRDIVDRLADIMISYPGPGTTDLLAEMIAKYVATIYSKDH
jgi:hypothetical protein